MKLKLVSFLLLFTIVASVAASFQPSATAQSAEGTPPFSVRTLENDTVSLDSYQGKVLLLDFFASWCPHCKDAALELREVRENFSSENLALLSVESDPDVPIENVENFKSKYGGGWPFAKAPKVAGRYGVEGYPTIFVVTPDGYIAENMKGAVPSDILSRTVADLLGTSKPVENQPTNVIINASADPENGGGIVTTSLEVKKDGELLFTYEAKANPGYEFVGWSGEAVPENQRNSPTLEIVPVMGTEVTANFTPVRGETEQTSGGSSSSFDLTSFMFGAAVVGCLGALSGYLVRGRKKE